MGDGIGIESRLNLPKRFRYERVVRKAKDYRAGDRRVIADLSGPGCVRHFHCVGSRGGSGATCSTATAPSSSVSTGTARNSRAWRSPWRPVRLFDGDGTAAGGRTLRP